MSAVFHPDEIDFPHDARPVPVPTQCCYMMPGGVKYAVRVTLVGRPLTLAYLPGTQLNHAARLADMAKFVFWKYRTWTGEPKDADFNFGVESARRDVADHPAYVARMLKHAPDKSPEPRPPTVLDRVRQLEACNTELRNRVTALEIKLENSSGTLDENVAP